MNNLRSKFLALCLIFSAFALYYACSSDNSGQNEADNKLTAEMAYACPMRCEGSGSNEPGKCPVCGMDLVKVGAEQEHSHGDGEDHSHGEGEGHDHEDEEGHDHGDEEHEHADEDGHHHEDGEHEHGEGGHDY